MVYDSNAKRSPERAILEIADDVHQIAVGNTLPVVDSGDNGDIMMVVEGEWAKAQLPDELPSVGAGDNGKVLGVADGEWDLVALRTYYTLTVTPDGNLTADDIDAPADIAQGGVAFIDVNASVDEAYCSITGAKMAVVVNDGGRSVVAIFNPTGNVSVTLSDEA